MTIGHGRDEASRAAASAFAEAWQARGGTVLARVDWPEDAASWLRPARRLTAQTPDAWVIAAAVPGFAHLARRLRRSTGFDPARTVAFASLADPRLPALTGPGTLDGLHGATPDGGTWEVPGGRLTSRQPAGQSEEFDASGNS
ncbi:ABC transporter substrate-binding protein [Kitasatospora sp. NPDC059599]|uniref:ABC transporter substrate-binding protein n=1 Tax=Kitasatospora sp. NPDC059599 TaxID=3346880 RepID=UPI0036BD273A